MKVFEVFSAILNGKKSQNTSHNKLLEKRKFRHPLKIFWRRLFTGFLVVLLVSILQFRHEWVVDNDQRTTVSHFISIWNMSLPLSLTSLYFEHFSISNITLFRTSLYIEHHSISNITLSRISLYFEHLSTSNISLPRTSFYF